MNQGPSTSATDGAAADRVAPREPTSGDASADAAGSDDAATRGTSPTEGDPQVLTEHTVEIVTDAGEGAQKCGQIFGAVCAKMGNGTWTVEIIPAEIQPPPRTPGSASGVRIRIGSEEVTNWGDEGQMAIVFNEQVLLSRHRMDALADDALILIEDMWAEHADERIRKEWATAMEELSTRNYRIVRVPMEQQCLTLTDNPRRGKNMFALGMLARIYDLDPERVAKQIAHEFRKKSQSVIDANVELMELGRSWAADNVPYRFSIPPRMNGHDMVVMNGNQALGMGAIAAGLELCSMYPITPATSVSHYLGEIFESVGGFVHQAEDEIAAIGVAIGASYAGKVAFTVTSGPGLALKTEFLGLAVMTETPLVVINVQRGGPSTGLPTKVEQSDLLATLFGQPGDAPKIVLAPATIEDCFHCMVSARRIAEALRCVVIILTDANLATGVQPFPRPALDSRWQARQPDQSDVPAGGKPFDWDPKLGISERFLPGRRGGMHTTTGLAHDAASKVTYAPDVNQHASTMRSRKVAVFQETLKPPTVVGPEYGDMLIVGWGSTIGAIQEAAERARSEGLLVATVHLSFLSPLEPGLKDIFSRYKRVMTVEINYSDRLGDPFITPENRRIGQLAFLLRAATLVDVDCWTRVPGEPLRPGRILDAIKDRLGRARAPKTSSNGEV